MALGNEGVRKRLAQQGVQVSRGLPTKNGYCPAQYNVMGLACIIGLWIHMCTLEGGHVSIDVGVGKKANVQSAV